MIRRKLARVRQLEAAELAWRGREIVEVQVSRIAARLNPPRWNRRDLTTALARTADLEDLRSALRHEQWDLAHRQIAARVRTDAPRFAISPAMRHTVVHAITQRFPHAAAEARDRAERLLAGRYDVLGYRNLPFDGSGWHTDPVHGKTAPLVFWSQVPYLDPECGDHKVTWELNRHQHWLQLGRAYWLTGDPRYRTECLRQLDTWLAANPPRTGMNWASMLELGFRAISWLWALNFFADGADDDASPWTVDLLLALDRQLTHVERHLSYYFSPNTHLLGEALALYVTGRVLPMLKASSRREDVGRRVLVAEMGRQIAADGGHCERSPHYHRYTLDFYLLALVVARVTDDPIAGVFERACARLAQTARLLADDRGILPLIGDDDGGSLFPIARRRPDDVSDSLAVAGALTGHADLLVTDPPEEAWWLLAQDRFADARARIERSARRVAPPSAALPATGYYISRNEHGDHVVIDGGRHGYLNGGHAHADALALTFTYRNRRFLIDPGTGFYTIDPRLRDRFRSSALHNTLTLNGRSQSQPRGPFHWERVADATARRWRSNRHFDYFVGTHDGYAPLCHYRHVLMMHDDVLVVADYVTISPAARADDAPPAAARADVHWHLAPEWAAQVAGRGATLSAGADRVELCVAGAAVEPFHGDEATGLGWHAPEYGRVEPTTSLRLTAHGGPPFWVVSAFGFDALNRIHDVSMEPVDPSGHTLEYGVAIRLTRDHSIDRLLVAERPDDQRHGCWRAIGFDTDACMLYTREVDHELVMLAAADVTTLHSDRYPHADRIYPARVSDLYQPIGRGSVQSEPPANGAMKRKAS